MSREVTLVYSVPNPDLGESHKIDFPLSLFIICYYTAVTWLRAFLYYIYKLKIQGQSTKFKVQYFVIYIDNFNQNIFCL